MLPGDMCATTMDCRLTPKLQPAKSHGPIRFAGNDVIMNLIGPCDQASQSFSVKQPAIHCSRVDRLPSVQCPAYYG